MADLNELLRQANEADASKDYAKAVSLYDHIMLSVAEEFKGKLHLYKGVSLFNAGNYAEAVNSFDEAIASNDSEILANSWSSKAKALEQLNNYEEAIEAHEGVLMVDTQKQFMDWAGYVHCCNQAKQYEKALDTAAKGLDAEPNKFEKLHNERIFAFFKLERPLDSLEDVEAVLKKRPLNQLRPEEIELYSEVLTQKGHDSLQKQNYPDALKYFQKVYDTTASAYSMFLLGVCYLRMKEDQKAKEWLEKSVEKDRATGANSWKTHVALGTVYMRPNTTDYEAATDHFSIALNASSEAQNPNVHFNNGFALMKLKRDAEAKNSLEFVYKNDPSNWIASALLGTVLVKEDKRESYERAVEVLERAIESSNGQADDSVYYNLAYAYMMLDRYKEARDNFKKAYEKNPANQDALKASKRMEDEIKAEEERKRKEEEEVRKLEEQKKREEEIRRENERLAAEAKKKAEEERIKAEKERNEALKKEAQRKAEEARKEAEHRAAEAIRIAKEQKEEAERIKKIKANEVRERRMKRLKELQVMIGGPQGNRARRPSLDLIPEGNTGKNAYAYADWYNEEVVKKNNGGYDPMAEKNKK